MRSSIFLLASLIVAGVAIRAAYGYTCPNMLPSKVDGTVTWGGQTICDGVPCPQNYSVPHTYPCNLVAPTRCCFVGTVVTTTLVSYTCDELDDCKKVTDELYGPGYVAGYCTATECLEGERPPD
jgi:hypothetical protein